MNDRQYADPDTGEMLIPRTLQGVPAVRDKGSVPASAVASEDLNEIAAALSKAQATFPDIKRNHKVDFTAKTGTRVKYDYADLAVIFAAVRKPLSDNGLAVVQFTVMAPAGVMLITRLLHSSGQWLASCWPISLRGSDQEQGSALTYAKRYQLSSLLGIHAEDDDDGAAASAPKEKATPKPAAPPAAPRKPVDQEAASFVEALDKEAAEHRAAGTLPEGVYEYFGIPTEVTHKDTAKGGKAFRVHFNDPSSDGVEWFGTFDTEIAATCEASAGKARLRLLYEKTKFGKKIMEIFPA